MKKLLIGMVGGLLIVVAGITLVLACLYEGLFQIIHIGRYGIVYGMRSLVKRAGPDVYLYGKWNRFINHIAKGDAYEASRFYDLKISSQEQEA